MIKVSKLSKFYGAKRALGPVSFEIEDGEAVGFLGLNGAGKTTALRMLACDLRPSAGTISIDGIDAVADPHQIRKRIGFLPENPPLYADMGVAEYLRFAAELRNVPSKNRTKRVGEVLELTNLRDVLGEAIWTLSHGYRQRVGVAQAIVHDPKLLILDEPTRGLDPVQIVEMRAMIKNLKVKHTVLISSYILPEISQTCDRLLVIGQGEIVKAGTEDELTHGLTVKTIAIALRRPEGGDDDAYRDGDFPRAVNDRLAKVEGVTSIGETREHNQVLSFAVHCDRDCRASIARAVVEGGWDLLSLGSMTSELEQTFVSLVGGNARN